MEACLLVLRGSGEYFFSCFLGNNGSNGHTKAENYERNDGPHECCGIGGSKEIPDSADKACSSC